MRCVRGDATGNEYAFTVITGRKWYCRLLGISAFAFAAAFGAGALPDNPYRRWQVIENTLAGDATWAYEQIHFDPSPLEVAIIGASRTQFGLSAPDIEARLTELDTPRKVADLFVLADGHKIQWAITDELFKVKRRRFLVILIQKTVYNWGHPGFKFAGRPAAVNSAIVDVPLRPMTRV